MGKIKKGLMKVVDEEKAKTLRRFFKTGKGQYGEGDIFLGVSVPNVRNIAQKYWAMTEINVIEKLLRSNIHEKRLVGLLILIEKYNHVGYEGGREALFKFYLANRKGVNNWDLVDLSAPNIVGDYLLHKKDREILYEFAKNENLWEKRIAIVATFAFIRDGQFGDTLKISKILLKDKHDLIHKAVGWMLREVGKRDRKVLEKFLRENYFGIPRTTLRYAIERFGEEERKRWLKGRDF
jgi:3-methyladenine DNA glycosylase AlkD